MLKSDVQPVASVVLAIAFGFVTMVLIAYLMRAMLKLQSDGTLDIRNALWKIGHGTCRSKAQLCRQGVADGAGQACRNGRRNG